MNPSTDGLAGAAPSRFDVVTRTLTGYQFVVFAVTAVVVAARLSGGGFVFDRSGGDPPRFAVVPFRPATAGQAPSPPNTAATMPARVQAPTALLAGGGGSDRFTSGTFTPPVTGDTAEPGPPSPQAADDGNLGDVFSFATVADPGRPTGVAVGPGGDVWVSTDTAPGKVLHFDAAGSWQKAYAIDGVLGGIPAVRLAADGRVYALSVDPPAVFALDPTTGVATRYSADIPDLQTPCAPEVVTETTDCDGSSANAKPALSAFAFGPTGTLVVADAAQGVLWKVPAGGGAPAWWRVFPTWTHPSPLRPSGMSGLAFDGGRNLLVTVKSTLTDPQDVGKVFAIPAGSDDHHSTTLLATFAPGSVPAGITIGQSGKVYVSLSGMRQVVVLDRSGAEVARTPTPTGALLGPVGLAFRGQSLLVADQGAHEVYRLPVGEPDGRLQW